MAEAPDQALVDALEEIVRSYVIAQMPADASSGEFATMPLRELLGIYWTWRERFPAPMPRVVHWSRELDASPLAARYGAELSELVRKMEEGENLTPHLSDRVETAYISDQERPNVQPANRRDADRDRMLSAWGIHHLHLSNAPGQGGFTARGKNLLYAIFRPEDAYLLGIYTHTDWARRELVEVIVRNWPDAGLFVKSNYAVGTKANFSDADRTQLRRAFINEGLIEVDGAFYGPPGMGLTAAGGSFAAARRAMGYMECIRQLRANLDHFLSSFARELDEAARHAVAGDWKPHIEGIHVGLQRGDDAFIGIPWLGVD